MGRLLTLAVSFALLAGAAQAQDVRWYTIVADDGARLGYASTEVVSGETAREIIDHQEYYLREQNSAPTRIVSRTVRREDAAGRTTGIVETTRTGDFLSRTEARVSDGRAEIVRETPSGTWRHDVVLPAGVRFDQGEGLLAAWDPALAPRLAFDSFSIGALGVEHVVFESDGARDGEGRLSAIRTRYERDQLRGVSRIIVDREGRIVEAAQPVYGETIWLRAADRATALRGHPPYPVVPNTMMRAPVRISAQAQRGHIRYRLSFRDGLAFDLPQTGEQRQSREGESVVVDICQGCGPGLATDDASLADARRATSWLQSDHERLRGIAATIARLDVSDTRKMELLIEGAQPFIARVDYSGHYSALDTIVRRAGDCTEAAVLLAALGRAAGIPTRVASGLTYSRESYHGVSNAFMPHSWTLAYVDGAWRSFDLALGAFDSTHIVLTIGDGDARSVAAAAQLASLLVFDNLAEVRVRR